jgi:hypothetical protein
LDLAGVIDRVCPMRDVGSLGHGQVIEGHVTQGWKQALNALSTVSEGRISEHAR